MLQQTRVEAVIPYYNSFLGRFPDIESLAEAPEPDVLTAWSGLGYYSRARNLQRAAKQITSRGFPGTFEELKELAGIGPYTAAAVASIALGLPYAAVDGNVIRVVSRLLNDSGEISSPLTIRRLQTEAQRLLDPRRPGDFNQAMMELGATVCTPRSPKCPVCPVARMCAAKAGGTESQLPVKLKRNVTRDVTVNLALLTGRNENRGRVFLIRRAAEERRLAGFWELPAKESFPGWKGRVAGQVAHQIVNDRFRITVWKGAAPPSLPAGAWFALDEVAGIPLSTVARKALAFAWHHTARHVPN